MRLWWNTAAFVFTHCLGTSPGRYGHAMVEQGQTVVLSGRRLDVPLSRQSAAVVLLRSWKRIGQRSSAPGKKIVPRNP